ncbi:hypothetical protein PR202_ga13791 [Eleusine coracana subsp. coracana]|uniref:ATP-dependent RNA helicase Ski2/MTR4 C-terminal domain-containing protein n=1 Tax=Eleusine coracana subsp. coracana TaxID=191504 RepID=A0AAV5CFW5_ELECO|nr:hypothetical protein PR202_ga13791 [Eleusine coracana subsp. coracana]
MRGIGVQHSGLLPLVRELVEILFQEGLLKFAMGINMPAKTVVFTSIEKFDGDVRHCIRSGEYTQMSGRAGRRGKDTSGKCVIIIDEKMEQSSIKEIVSGKPAPLLSTFHLSYGTILKSQKRTFTVKDVFENSFCMFQAEKATPSLDEKIKMLESQVAEHDAAGIDVAEYHKLDHKISEIQKKINYVMIKPDPGYLKRVIGRLVYVRDGSTDWGWGLVASELKKESGSQTKSPAMVASRKIECTVDILVCCSTSSKKESDRKLPCPGDTGKLDEKYPQGVPDADPIKDLDIQDAELIEWVHELENLLQKNALIHCLSVDRQRMNFCVRKRPKGLAASLIESGDQLLIPEVMFEGVFKDLDYRQVATLASCFIPCGSTKKTKVPSQLSDSMMQLKDAARNIAKVQQRYKLEIDVDEYVRLSSRTCLMDVVDRWIKGEIFEQVVTSTDIMPVLRSLQISLFSALAGIWIIYIEIKR